MQGHFAFFVALILAFALLAPHVSAVSPDPNRVTPWEYKGQSTPSGDDTGWNDIDALPPHHFVFVCKVSFLAQLGDRWFKIRFGSYVLPVSISVEGEGHESAPSGNRSLNPK